MKDVNLNNSLFDIEDYLKVIRSLMESSNFYEAESMCNKLIDIEDKNHKVWFLKGKSIGRQSSTSHLFLKDAFYSFKKAIDFAPVEIKNDIIAEVKNEANILILSLMLLWAEEFKSNFSGIETRKFISVYNKIIKSFLDYRRIVRNHFDQDEIDEVNTKIFIIFHKSISEVFDSEIAETYARLEQNPYEFESTYKLFIEQVGYCTYLFEISILFGSHTSKNTIHLYEGLIAFNNYVIDASQLYINRHHNLLIEKKKEINIEIERRNLWNEKYKQEIKKLYAKEYWDNNVLKKENLEKEYEVHKDKIRELELKLQPFDGENELVILKNDIDELVNNRSKLSIFSRKERKLLSDEIELLKNELSSKEKQILLEKSLINEKIVKHKSKLDIIQTTLLNPIDD